MSNDEVKLRRLFADNGALRRSIRLLDGRIVEISTTTPFSIKSDSSSHRWDLSWVPPKAVWGSLMIETLLGLLQTHSVQYSNNIAYVASVLYKNSLFQSDRPIELDQIAKIPEVIPLYHWPPLRALLNKMIRMDTAGALSDDLKKFLEQPNKWEEKKKGAYFSLITNDPVHGAFTEQELLSIQDGVNKAYEESLISLEQYTLVWFLIGTGVRPIQMARMKIGDVKIYDGPEGKELTLFIPLAKGEGAPDQGRWRRRCPTVLAEIMITYIKRLNGDESCSLFKDQAIKIREALRLVFKKVETYSERTGSRINIFPYRFRYTLGTRAIALGGSDEEVARLLTHRRIHSVASYRAAMPQLQKPIKDALSGEMSIIASAFRGRVIQNLKGATRKGQVDALIRDFLHLNGEAIGACGTEVKCYQHAPRSCLLCRKFEPFINAPWNELIATLQADMDSEEDEKIKLITLPLIKSAKAIEQKCNEKKGVVK